MDRKGECCGNCWFRDDTLVNEDLKKFWTLCHRFPPISGRDGHYHGWPLVNKDRWCGEYLRDKSQDPKRPKYPPFRRSLPEVTVEPFEKSQQEFYERQIDG